MRIDGAAFAASWLAGLSLGLEFGQWSSMHLIIAAVLPAALGAKLRHRRYAHAGACLMLFAVSVAYGMWSERSGVSRLPEQADAFTLGGTIASPVVTDGDRVRFTLRAEQPVREKVMATVRLESPEQVAAVAAWRRGDAIVMAGELSLPAIARNFGQFDYRRYLDRLNIRRTITVDGLSFVETAPPEGIGRFAPMRVADKWRGWLDERIMELYGKHRGLMSGLLIGLRDHMEEERFMQFSRLGLTHIIAISGLHVAVVVGACLAAMRLMRMTRETSLSVAMLLIPPYVLLSGASPSAVRAGIMAMIALYAARRGWLKNGLNVLAAAALLMTLWNPYLIYNISFQLSFAVTAGLVLFVPAALRFLPERPKWASGAVAVALSAQLSAFPLTIFYFNQFSLLSLPANLLIVPLFSFIVLPGGYVSLAMSLLPLPLAHWIARAISVPVELSYHLMDLLDAVPGMLTIWPTPPFGWIAVYAVLLLRIVSALLRCTGEDADLHPRSLRKARAELLAAAALFGLWLALGYHLQDWKDRGSVSFLDVGQGDAILIRSPHGKVVLVDGGGTLRFDKPGELWRRGMDPYEVGEDLLVPLLKKRGIRSIDYMIATHGDADHVGGLPAVIERFPVKRLLFNGTVRLNEPSANLFQAALSRNIPIQAVAEGERFSVDGLTTIDILHPESGPLTVLDKQNSRSVVFMLTMRSATFLFTGDMDAAAEGEVLGRLSTPADSLSRKVRSDPVDVMKVAHHGSKSSTTAAWLHFWKPRLSVISAGEHNVYGHPAPPVLRRLSDRGIPVLRTDRHGEIGVAVLPSGLRWRVKLDWESN